MERTQGTLVAGVDSSTQACKVVVRDAAGGELVREGRAPHPDGTEVDPAGETSTSTVAAASVSTQTVAWASPT